MARPFSIGRAGGILISVGPRGRLPLGALPCAQVGYSIIIFISASFNTIW